MARKPTRGRHDKPRAERPVTLIVCEGETEQNYFNAIRNRYRANGMVVRLSDESNPRAILSCARRERRRLEQEERVRVAQTWLVFDAETEAAQRERRYAETIREALKAGFEVANSSPRFEYWPLLHFASNPMVLTPADAGRELSKDERIPGYRKPRLPFDQLWELYQTGRPSKAAQKRRLDLESLGEDPRLGRPVTYVDELVDGLAQAYGAKENG